MASDESDHKKEVMLFGRDISKIPCFRNSFLYGICSGLGTGLAVFMLTSRPKRASDWGMATFCVVTLSYWTHCRYNYSKLKFEMEQMRKGVEDYMHSEGTPELAEPNTPVEV